MMIKANKIHLGAVALFTGLITGCGTMQSKEPLYIHMTDVDVLLADETVQYSLEQTQSNTRSSWNNPNSGNGGSITPTQTFKHEQGYYCRNYTEQLRVQNEHEVYQEVACRSTNGTWYPL